MNNIGIFHTIPVRDNQEHVLFDECECQPKYRYNSMGLLIAVNHKRFDKTDETKLFGKIIPRESSRHSHYV